MTEEMPFIAIGEGEIGGQLGNTISCNLCGKDHPITSTKSTTGKLTMQSYNCGDNAYICGINGRKI